MTLSERMDEVVWLAARYRERYTGIPAAEVAGRIDTWSLPKPRTERHLEQIAAAIAAAEAAYYAQ